MGADGKMEARHLEVAFETLTAFLCPFSRRSSFLRARPSVPTLGSQARPPVPFRSLQGPLIQASPRPRAPRDGRHVLRRDSSPRVLPHVPLATMEASQQRSEFRPGRCNLDYQAQGTLPKGSLGQVSRRYMQGTGAAPSPGA